MSTAFDLSESIDDDPTTYFAAESDPYTLAKRLQKRIAVYRQWLTDTGRADRIRRMWACIWGFAPDGGGDTSQARPSGNQGELLEVTTNEVMTLVEQTSAMMLNQKPAGKAVARNADFTSLAQTRFADGLLEYCEGEKDWAEYDSQALTLALALSEAWEIDSWDRILGAFDGVDEEGTPEYDGDISTTVATPFDVAYDPLTVGRDKQQWILFRYRANRFDEAARADKTDPELAKRLRKYNPDTSAGDGWGKDEDWELTRWGSHNTQRSNSLVWVWELRALPSPALPQGRLFRFVSCDIILRDSLTPGRDGTPGHYPYTSNEISRLHAYQLRAKAVPGSLAGYSHHFDLLGLQELLDISYTAAASITSFGGVPNIYVGPVSNYQPGQMSGGFRFLEGASEPKLVEQPKVDPSLGGVISLVVQTMRRRVGQNNVSSGETEKGMPAQLAALLQAQAVQYANSLQASLVRMFEESRTGRVYLYKEFASSKRVAMIAGAAGSWAMKEWQGSDLDAIERVTVEEIPAMLRTEAGRLQVGQMMVEQNLVTDRHELLMLITTGQDKPLYEGAESNLLRIQQEKELLMQGIGLPPVQMMPNGQPARMPDGSPVFTDPPTQPGQQAQTFIRPVITDTPWLDIPEYATVIQNPVSRGNMAVVKAVTDLITYKMHLWQQTPPMLQALLGCPPDKIMLPPGMPPPGAAPTSPQPDGAKQAPGAPPAKPTTKAGALPAGSPGINLPAPPKNPLNGSQPPPVDTGNGATA